MKIVEFRFNVGDGAYMLYGSEIIVGKIRQMEYFFGNCQRTGTKTYTFSPESSHFVARKAVAEHKLFFTKKECMLSIMTENGITTGILEEEGEEYE